MKQLFIFKDGTRMIGDSQALVLPQHPAKITKRHNLSFATDAELVNLKQNPHNDGLLQQIEKRRKL